MSIKLADAVDDNSQVSAWQSAMSSIKSGVSTSLWDPSQNLFFDNDQDQSSTALHPQDGNSWAIIAGLVSDSQAALISTSLAKRWIRPYGAPAPEASVAISPFASGFEVQAHYLAGHPERAVELIEFMWADFMLDDPRMTNSSLIEGYSSNGDLHYPPYDNDARVSHAHGWATGPTSTLTFFGAGIQLTSAIGKTWLVQPKLGGLQRLTSGYKTPLGEFSASWAAASADGVVGSFSTPAGTSGILTIPSGNGRLVVTGPIGVASPLPAGDNVYTSYNLAGGDYEITQG